MCIRDRVGTQADDAHDVTPRWWPTYASRVAPSLAATGRVLGSGPEPHLPAGHGVALARHAADAFDEHLPLHHLDAVSYTHLDVYKRQGLAGARRQVPADARDADLGAIAVLRTDIPAARRVVSDEHLSLIHI